VNDPLIEQVRAIQASMVESGAPFFLETELDNLRVLIRLTIEFFHYIQQDEFWVAPAVKDQLRYVCESIFSGVDSFGLISPAYQLVPGARYSTLAFHVESTESLKKEFGSLYLDFYYEKDFEKQCRLLLDLFKLQIVFAGLSY
jgi:hypothetical protein